MIRGKFLTSNDDISQILDIRRRVFVDEQGFSPDAEVDQFDDMAVYALVFDEADRPAGTGRLSIDLDGHFRIGRVCVLGGARGQGLGDLILRMLLFRAQELNADSVHVEAQLPAVDFYRRFGFRPYGDITHDEGVAHRMMRVEAADIDLEGTGCAGCEGRLP
jgi:predicted GNAT family N-acyltransferase